MIEQIQGMIENFRERLHPEKSYPLVVFGIEKRGNGFAPKLTRAKRVPSALEGDKYVFKDDPKNPTTVKPYKYLYQGRNILMLPMYFPETGDAHPIQFDFSKIEDKENSVLGLNVVEEDMRLMHVQNQKVIRNRTTVPNSMADFMKNALPILLSFIFMYIFWDLMAGSLQDISGSVASAGTQLTEALKTAKSCQIVPVQQM